MKWLFVLLVRSFYFFSLYLRFKIRVKSLCVSTKAKLGRRVLIERGVKIDQYSKIGDFSYINENARIESAVIGRFCSIATGVIIGPNMHNISSISTHPFNKEPFYGFVAHREHYEYMKSHVGKQTIISDDVWVGANAIILNGANIGVGAVVGAGAVVTKDIPCYEIWGGVPAKKIRDRFSKEIRDVLVDSEWTKQSDEWIVSNILPNYYNVARLQKRKK